MSNAKGGFGKNSIFAQNKGSSSIETKAIEKQQGIPTPPVSPSQFDTSPRQVLLQYLHFQIPTIHLPVIILLQSPTKPII